MWRRQSLHLWTCLIAAAFVAGGRLIVHADDQPASSDGYKTVPVNAGGKTVPIRVQEQPDALAHASFPDQLDPQRVFSATNPMSNKQFLLPSDSVSQSSANFKNRDQNTFITKPYALDSSAPSVPNLNTKAGAGFPTTSAYSRNATGFDKNYATPNANVGQNQPALLASATSSDQGRTAVLGTNTTSTFASAFAGKNFEGPEADAAKRHLSRMKNGQILVTDLPGRPLTIDEVRDLINHGFKPNTNVKPAEPSKPLNDPNYVPEPMRDNPNPSPDTTKPTPASDDDKDDPVPPPGTMAAPPAPENSQPLPQP